MSYEGESAEDVVEGWYWNGWTGSKSGLTIEEFVGNWSKTVPGVTPDMPAIEFLRAITAKFPNAFTLTEGTAISRLADRTGPLNNSATRILSSGV